MNRLIAALSVLLALILLVAVGQSYLSRTTEDLASRADEVCQKLSAEETGAEGLRLLSELIDEVDRKRLVLGIFVNDVRIYEIQRALCRAERLGAEGDLSPVFEALSDLSETFWEIAGTHRPSLENIL